jgi:hypothetical protein
VLPAQVTPTRTPLGVVLPNAGSGGISGQGRDATLLIVTALVSIAGAGTAIGMRERRRREGP